MIAAEAIGQINVIAVWRDRNPICPAEACESAIPPEASPDTVDCRSSPFRLSERANHCNTLFSVAEVESTRQWSGTGP